MNKESGLFEDNIVAKEDKNYYHDFNLLKTTASSRLWRVSRDGKYFLVKTTKDNSEFQTKMLRREYELSIGCDNPNIVHVFTYENDIHEGDGIVMEYIEGRTLSEFLLEKPSLNKRQRIFAELLSAVNYLHKRGIIHNDLKPENILITRADDTLKIIDFGLADKDAFYVWKTLGCTQKYASPELRNQTENIDVRSDIYSIGLIMKEIFDGRYRHIINRCCKENPKQRFSDVDDLQKKWNNRNKVWKSLAVLLILFVASFPTYLYFSEGNAEKKEIAMRETKIEQIKEGAKMMLEELYIEIKSNVDADGYIELSKYSEIMQDFAKKWTQYQEDNVYNNPDPEVVQRAMLETTKIYNEHCKLRVF